MARETKIGTIDAIFQLAQAPGMLLKPLVGMCPGDLRGKVSASPKRECAKENGFKGVYQSQRVYTGRKSWGISGMSAFLQL